MKQKNQLKRFRKRLQQSFESFCQLVTFVYYKENMKTSNYLDSCYKQFCKKMLYVTLGFIVFNCIILLLNLFICRIL